MPTMLHLAGVRRRDLVLSILAGAVTLLSALSLTVLSGWLITRAWEMPPVLDLSVAITAVRALGISRAVFRYLDRLVSHRLALDALATLRSRLFSSLVRDGHTRTRGDGLVALVADAERITDLIVRSLVPRGVAVVLSVAAVLAAGWLHPLAGLTLAVAYLVTGLLIPRLAARAARGTAMPGDDTFDVVERLTAWAADRGHTVLELAFAWLLAKPTVASVIAGATKVAQVRANAAVTWRLTADEVAEVDALTVPVTSSSA